VENSFEDWMTGYSTCKKQQEKITQILMNNRGKLGKALPSKKIFPVVLRIFKVNGNVGNLEGIKERKQL